jgi:hypothetical protein
MSPSSRPIHTSLRACAAGAAAVVLLTACAGAGEKTATAPPQTASAAGGGASHTAVAPAAVDFCRQAAGIDARVDAALSDLDGGHASLPDAFHQIATELRDISAPAAIASDWQAMAAGLDRMADALADVDITDLHRLEAAEGDLTTSSGKVDSYLGAECGTSR